MRFLSGLYPKGIYAKLVGVLSVGVVLLIVSYLALVNHQRDHMADVERTWVGEISRNFKELLHLGAIPIEGYLSSSSVVERDQEHFDAMYGVWERVLAGMEGIGYDAAIMFDEDLTPVAFKSMIDKFDEKLMLNAIPTEALSLVYPVSSNFFARLSDKRIVQVFVSPVRAIALSIDIDSASHKDSAVDDSSVLGYVVAMKLWDRSEMSLIERLMNQKADMFVSGDEIADNKYDIFYSLKDFYGRGIATIGIALDKRFQDFVSNVFFMQMIVIGFIGILIVGIMTILFFTLILRPLHLLSMALQNRNKKSLAELLKKSDEFGDIARIVQQFFKQNAILEQYKQAIDIGYIVSKGDLRGNIIYVNKQFCEISGYEREELLGRNHNMLRHPDNSREFFAMMWKRISSGKIWSGVIKNRNKYGGDYYVRAVIVPLINDDGVIEEYLSIRTDITELYEQMQMIISQTTDLLTGLPNKQQLFQDLESDPVIRTLIFININRFRSINDSFGEKVGDMLLIEFVRRLEMMLPVEAGVYRIGGNEFAILFGNDEDPGIFAANLAKNLEENPFVVSGMEVFMGVRVAAACGLELLYQKCDMAMNYAKINNLSYVDFDRNSQIRDELERSKEVTSMIQEAIRYDFIQAYGQKIVSVKDPKVFKVETLMRIVDDKGKVISPFIFLEHAKNSRLYSRLTRIMMKKVFDGFKDSNIEFSINLTFEDILDKETTVQILDSIQSMDIGKYVTIELVESEQIGASKEVDEFLKEAKLLGCKISIDDFGSGYSNFDYILRIGADFIKIDGSLIKNIDTDKNSYLTVKTIVSLAKELGIGIVAEFIHSQSVMDVVVELGVDYLQGYHLHQPESIETLLAKEVKAE